MKNFYRLAEGVDVVPIMHALMRHDLWNHNRLRTTHPGTPHTEVDDIWLRFNDLKDLSNVMDEHESVNYPAFLSLPCRGIVFDLMRRVEGERLGRVLITRLKPGGHIAAHVDSGDHAAYYQRHHIVLQGLPGSLFRCGDETVNMRTGECWWFDNAVEHEVWNNSADDRVHMIVDIKC